MSEKFYALCLCDGETGERLILSKSPLLKAKAVAADDYLGFASGVIAALQWHARPQLDRDAKANGRRLTPVGSLPEGVEEWRPVDAVPAADDSCITMVRPSRISRT